MLGDFNLDWSSKSVLKQSFETLMSLNRYSQLVNEYTRCFKNSNRIIDFLITNIQNLVSEHHIIKTNISDHFAINLQANCKPPNPVFSFITKRDFHKLNFSNLLNLLVVEEINDVHRAAKS